MRVNGYTQSWGRCSCWWDATASRLIPALLSPDVDHTRKTFTVGYTSGKRGNCFSPHWLIIGSHGAGAGGNDLLIGTSSVVSRGTLLVRKDSRHSGMISSWCVIIRAVRVCQDTSTRSLVCTMSRVVSHKLEQELELLSMSTHASSNSPTNLWPHSATWPCAAGTISEASHILLSREAETVLRLLFESFTTEKKEKNTRLQ